MKWIKGYQLFKESKTYSNKNIISEICIAMVLLNNEFLDNIIDRGQKARYSESSQIFLTDLKNLLLSKNRLHLGKFVDGECVADDELSKVNGYFNDVDFDIEKDWTKLVNCRITARNIIDKLLPDEKLSPDRIRKIYWIGPNKDDEFNEDIVIETTEGSQYSIFIDKNLTLQKSSSFNTFAEELIGDDINNLFSEDNISKWDKLTQEFIRITYECSNKNVQMHIEKFIDPKRIDSINYFDYFSIRHRDPRFKHLGEFMKEFDKNILKLSDLLNEIWKKKEVHLSNLERAEKEWTEVKIVILNSKILENLLTTSLRADKDDEIVKLEDGFKKGEGTIKMKLIKTLVEKMGCKERTLYYLSNNGNNFYQIPSREFFREHYNDIDLHFDYHVKFKLKDDEENIGSNDFNIKVRLMLNEEELISMDILVLFSGGEFTSKLTAKHRFNITPNFNYKVSKISKGEDQ